MSSKAVAKLLIRSGADVNAKDKVSVTLILVYDTFNHFITIISFYY